MYLRAFIVAAYAFLFPIISLADSAVLTASPGKNVYLRVNERIMSPSGNLVLVMQSDGNLVTYKSNCVGNPKCAVWNSNTSQEKGAYFLAMQEDGNLVIYRGTPENSRGVIWNSQSPGALGDYFLTLQDDENLVVCRGTGPADSQGTIWSTKGGLLQAGRTLTNGSSPVPSTNAHADKLTGGNTSATSSRQYAKKSIRYHSDCYGVSERVENLLEENKYDQLIYGRMRFARDAKDRIGDCNHPLALQAVNDINNFLRIGSAVRDSTNDTLQDIAEENVGKAREEGRMVSGGNFMNVLGKLIVDSAQTSRAFGAAERHGKSITALMDARL